MVDIAREAYAIKMSRFERVLRRSCSGGRERSGPRCVIRSPVTGGAGGRAHQTHTEWPQTPKTT